MITRICRWSVAVAVLGLVVTGCATSHAHHTAPTPVTMVKPDITGLLDRKGPPPVAFVSVLGGFVINAPWSQLQPNGAGTPIITTVIDQELARLNALDAAGGHMYVKLRVFAGIRAPAWAKNIGGAPFAVYDPYAHTGGTVGRFWLPAYGAAYDNLTNQLAAKYDGDPRVRDVTISRCMTVFAEPFIRQTGDPTTVRNFLAAGFTVAQDETCYKEQIDEANVWKHTHSSLSLNPYQQINPDGTTTMNLALTVSMMDYCRRVLAHRCTLENNSIRATSKDNGRGLYSAIKARGGAICYQTDESRFVGNLATTIQFGDTYGAVAIELPNNYTTTLAPAQVPAIAQQLRTNGPAT